MGIFMSVEIRVGTGLSRPVFASIEKTEIPVSPEFVT